MTNHETLVSHEAPQPGSDRSFGLVIGGVLLAIALYQYLNDSTVFLWYGCIGMIFSMLAFVAPKSLHQLNVAWMKLGLILGRIVTPVVMAIVYLLTVVPIGMLLRLSGKELLSLKAKPEQESYWIERQPPGPSAESLKDQF